MRTRLLLCFGLALSLTAPVAMPEPAQAITINLHIGSVLNHGRSISCREGERILRHRGFRDIRREDCSGRFFIYRARRDGGRYEIAVNRHNGRVVDVRRIRRW